MGKTRPPDPVERKRRALEARFGGEFHAVIALAHLVAWVDSIKVQRLGDGRFLCSYYITLDDWNVWVSKDDPRNRDLRFRGRA